jgi:WD40-like Beta Propeller Repeat
VRGRLARRRRLTIGALVGLAVLLAACTSIVRASVANDGTQGNDISWIPSLSHDGRYVAFESSASNLVPGDTNNVSDIFVRDLVAKTIVRVSVNSNGVQADRNSSRPRIDDSGQFVAFISDSAKLGGTFALWAYVRNTKTGVTEPILPTDNFDLDLSGSSRYVALVVSGNLDVYDRFAQTVDTIAGPASKPTLSDNGQYVAFMRPRPSGSGGATDIFVRDRVAGTTTQVPFPAPSTGYPSYISGSDPQISGNGRYVAYTESELVSAEPPDTFSYRNDIFVYDRQAGTLERADVRSDGTPGHDLDAEVHAISDDGRDVMFRSGGLVPDDNGAENEYVRDRVAHQTYLVDRNQDEKIADDWSSYGSDISGDGNRVAMSSQATNLVPNDTNGTIDVFVRAFPGAPAPPPPSTTTTQPRIPDVRLIPACTSAQPYAVRMRVENFPVEELRNNMKITYHDNSTFTNGWWFTPDSTGAATFPYVVPNATQPYGFEFDIFVDTDHDGVHDLNEGTVGTGFINISQPCSSPTP